MTAEYCTGAVCFIPLDASSPSFFGFSDFLTGLALMVLAWTIADVRYHFRVRIAPLPLRGIMFSVVAFVGFFTLLTDLWRAEQWLVPKANFLTPATWQALLGGLFLLTFLSWAWFAFIRPYDFGKRNASRYAHTLHWYILKGSPVELAVIADEFTYSAKALIRHATDRGLLKNFKGAESQSNKPAEVETYANDLLLMIADKRFCRAIVESSPGTALAIFQEIAEAKKYGIQIDTFARNIVDEALVNKNSFLYHESEGYETGYFGYAKPLSQAMFSKYLMVETIGTLLDPDIMGKRKWDAAQWEAYCRIVLLVFQNYVEEGFSGHSYTLFRAKGYIEQAAFDIYKLDGVEDSSWDSDSQARLRIVVKFIEDAVKILDKKSVPKNLILRVRDSNRFAQWPFYDYLAEMIFKVILIASNVTKPRSQCWWIQHNSVWGELFNFGRLDGTAGKIVKFKVRRLLYNEIVKLKQFPNFKGASVLRFCLNMMGFTIRKEDYSHDSLALQKAVLSWTKNNFAWLHSKNSRVADACFVDGFSFDSVNSRIVKTTPAEDLRLEPRYEYLEVAKAKESLTSAAAI